jgi:hypothetical protein
VVVGAVVVVGGGVVVVGAWVALSLGVVVAGGAVVVVGAVLFVVVWFVVVDDGGVDVLVFGVVLGVGRSVAWPKRLPMVVPLFPPETGPWLSSSNPVTAAMPIRNAPAVRAIAVRKVNRRRDGLTVGRRNTVGASGSTSSVRTVEGAAGSLRDPLTDSTPDVVVTTAVSLGAASGVAGSPTWPLRTSLTFDRTVRTVRAVLSRERW